LIFAFQERRTKKTDFTAKARRTPEKQLFNESNPLHDSQLPIRFSAVAPSR
jgi:hypothetical protein